MLVLTRRAGESVMIDGHIEIKVLRIRGNQVHLGIDAPAETMVHRHEVWARLQQAPELGTTARADEADPKTSNRGQDDLPEAALATSQSDSRY